MGPERMVKTPTIGSVFTIDNTLRARTRRSWVFDATLAMIVGLQGLAQTFGIGAPVAIGILTAVVSMVVLVFRRVAPLPVFLTTWALAVFGGIFDVRLGVQLAVLVALFTVAARRPRPDTVLATVLSEAAVLVGSIIISGAEFWIVGTFLTGMVAAAVGLGLFINTRRAYVAELRDRAARLERERDQQGELAVAAERTRIAREMHDVMAHNLAVMISLSDGAIAAAATSPERAVEAMRAASATGRQALGDTRRLLGVLRDQPDDERHPVPDLGQLDALIARVRSTGLPVTYEVTGVADTLPAGVQLTVFRLVQEALTNTLKHAGDSARATVRVRYAPDEVQVDVEDDGAGIGAPVPVSSGAGLIGMRERVQTFGGDLQTGPGLGGGWHVSARLRAEGAP